MNPEEFAASRLKAFGDWLNRQRTDCWIKGEKQSQVAILTRSGISRNYWNQLERGEHKPSDEMLGKIALGLGFDRDDTRFAHMYNLLYCHPEPGDKLLPDLPEIFHQYLPLPQTDKEDIDTLIALKFRRMTGRDQNRYIPPSFDPDIVETEDYSMAAGSGATEQGSQEERTRAANEDAMRADDEQRGNKIIRRRGDNDV